MRNRGANLDLENDIPNLFSFISTTNNVDILKRLFELYPDINLNTLFKSIYNENVMTTILANAIGFSRNNTAVIDTLISHGVDVNFKPGRMRPPVMIAAIGNSLAALKSLIVAGADCSEVFKLYNYSVYKKLSKTPTHIHTKNSSKQ